MGTNRILFVTLVFLLTSLNMAGNTPYVFKHIDVMDGLPDNQARGLFFASDGRLGVYTTVLINLYDGSRFESFPYASRNLYNFAEEVFYHCDYTDNQHRLWIKERNVLHAFDLITEHYIEVDSLLQSLGISQRLNNMFVESGSRYWFETNNGNVLCYNTENDSLYTVYTGNELAKHYGRLVEVKGYGDLCWMIHERGFIRCWDIQSGKFVRQITDFTDVIRPGDKIGMSVLSNGDFWLIWDRGVAYYDAFGQSWSRIENIRIEKQDLLTAIDTDSEGNAWIGSSQSGIYIINRRSLAVQHIEKIPIWGSGHISNDVTDIAIDPTDGGVWISFLNRALAYHHPSMRKFHLVDNKTTGGVSFDENVRCLLEIDNGNILLGTGKGLYCYDPKNQSMTIPYPELADILCNYLYRDTKKRIWLATFHSGLYCIDGTTIDRYYDPKINYQSIPHSHNIRSMVEDENGNFWVCVHRGGLAAFDPEKGTFNLLSDKYPDLRPFYMSLTMLKDGEGRLIVGSYNGLYYYDTKNDSLWIPEIDCPKDERFIHTNNKYNCLFRDSRGLTWFGTQNGLNVVDMARNQIYRLERKDGLNNSTIQCILEDSNKDIWVSTANGLSRIWVNMDNGGYTFNITGFNPDDGLQNEEYNIQSGLKTLDGTLYFGGVNGISTFVPENIIYKKSHNSPIFTSFWLFNQPVIPGSEYQGRVIMEQGISYTKQLTLKHNENFFSLTFAGLNYVNPSQTYYRYFLEGFDSRWTEIRPSDGVGTASYTGLPPGKYTFKVYTANNDKQWSEHAAEMVIHILPPFWKTIWAYMLYTVCIVILVAYILVRFDKRNKLKITEAQQLDAQQRKEELNQMKFRFFTNISHEFRTPLTLIITPLEAYLRKMTDEVGKKQLQAVYMNAQNLLGLVNQLLDFRKLEMKGEKLNLLHGEMNEFIEQIYQSFQTLATEKNIKFLFECSPEPIYMNFDREKISRIVNNLLSNAFKFTPDGGNVLLSLCKERSEVEECYRLRIDVIDTGTGIPAEDMDAVFERFYQVQKPTEEKTGSGIGLHLVKEYTELHKGSVMVKSRQGEGATFTIYLPLNLKATMGNVTVDLASQHVGQEKDTKPLTKSTLLLVEDNLEFRSFLKEELKEWYSVIEATDGEEGEKLALAHEPDLIVSDIMMPKVDGIELCKRIKHNIQTSHIPVVLLTARAADESKAMGYEAGADSYISKPFSFDMLLIRIRKLIEQRQKRQELFRTNVEVTPSLITITSLDEKLVQKALECVEQNIDNSEYSVEELSSDVGLHRMHLYRKLQSITGKTPTEFIRIIRLKRAAQLLKESQLTVSEITYMVGFSTPQYFRKVFKDEFGVSPGQYGKK